MFKSLYSGISGLSANLTALDVIGNNIANSNTVGFKAGRVTFNEMLTQTMRSASRPVSGGLGGTNPQQVGLGTQVGSIDTNFNQGNFQTTGSQTDLAIQGSGFFVLSDGISSVYTRAGVFGLDSASYLVNPATGLKVQGVMADANGVIGTGPLTDIFIDPGLVVPAEASTAVELIGNLNADSDATATIRESDSFLAAAGGGDRLLAMCGEGGQSLNLNDGNLISLSGRDAADQSLTTETFTVGDSTTYADLVTWLNGLVAGLTFTIAANGSLDVTNGTGQEISGLGLTVPAKNIFNQNFQFETPIANGAGSNTANRSDSYGELRAYADETDLLTELYSANGKELGLVAGTSLVTIDGAVGGDAMPTGNLAVTAGSTLGDLMREIGYTLGVNSNPVTINEFGQIVVQGEVGLTSELGEINLAELGAMNDELEGVGFTQTQQARDQRTYSLATTIYDSLGGEHTVTFTFEKVAGVNEWIWTAGVDGTEQIISGGSGRVAFSSTGALSNFTFDGGASALTIRPQPMGEEGAEDIVVNIDAGTIGGVTGLTQFEGSGTLQSIADGFGAGQLVDFSIDQTGTISGQFSNDTIRNIARIAVAQFANPAGLMREANNTYRQSGNSGQAAETFAGEGNGVTLVPGALEASNVDLAVEFTRLVVAQRAFQANSRVITTGDQVMQELVNLVR